MYVCFLACREGLLKENSALHSGPHIYIYIYIYIYRQGSERVYVQKQNIFVKVSRFSRWMLLKIVS